MALIGVMIVEPNNNRGSLDTWMCILQLILVCQLNLVIFALFPLQFFLLISNCNLSKHIETFATNFILDVMYLIQNYKLLL